MIIYCGYFNKYNVEEFNDLLYSELQIELFDKYLFYKEFENISFFTNSPYILNYLNLLIIKNKIDFNKLDVIFIEKDSKEISLKALNHNVINTNLFSDTINEIYNEFEVIKNINN